MSKVKIASPAVTPVVGDAPPHDWLKYGAIAAVLGFLGFYFWKLRGNHDET